MNFKNVDFLDDDYKDNQNYLEFVNDLYKGTREVKKKGRTYLKQFYLEEDFIYLNRLKYSTLYNHFQKSINNLASLILRKEPKIDYKVKNENFIKNIDGKGSSLNSFIKEVSKNSLIDGISYIWVDNQKVEEAVSVLNKNSFQPFLKNIKRSDVINKKISYESGIAKLTQITIKQSILVEVDDFTTKEDNIYVVMQIGKGYILKKKAKTKNEFEIIDSWTNTLNYIPIIPVYSSKTGFLEADIPFLDLAYMNIKHFNTQSSYDNIIELSALPVPVLYTQNEFDKKTLKKEGISIGINKALSFSDKTSEGFEWKEITGSSIDKIKENLSDTEDKLDKMSLSFLTNLSFNTATEAKIADSNNNLFLIELATSLEDAFNTAFLIMGNFLDTVLDITLTLNKDFESLALDSTTIDKLISMKNAGLISLDTFWDELIKGEVLNISDYDLEKQKIEEEQARLI